MFAYSPLPSLSSFLHRTPCAGRICQLSLTTEPSRSRCFVGWKLLAPRQFVRNLAIFVSFRAGYGCRWETANMSIDESRVTLRGFTTDDLPGFLEWATDDEVTKWLLWDSYTSEEDALNFLQNVAIPHPWLKAICVDGEAAGSIVVERGTGFEACRGVMGYCLARKYWGMGVATIAVKQMLALVFQGMDIARVEAVVVQDNVASRRVLEKAGFKLEGAMAKYLLIKDKLIDCFLLATYAPDHAANPPPS